MYQVAVTEAKDRFSELINAAMIGEEVFIRKIDDPTVQPFLSMASLWEIAIKVSIGKLELAQPLETLISRQLSLTGYGDTKPGVQSVALDSWFTIYN